MPGIGIILNPHSRCNRKNPERIDRLGFIVGDKGSCKATQDIDDLPVIIKEFKERDIDILGISGGDGTNHCTITTIINEYGEKPLPKIAFLRGGTMNAIANALDIHGSPEQILSNLILKYHEDQEFKTTEVDMINVNGLYGFLFGNGLVSRFIELYYKNKGSPVDAFILLCRIMFGTMFNSRLALEVCERFDAEVTVGSEKWKFKNYAFLAAGTVETFNFGFKPLYRSRSKPHFFQAIGCSAAPRTILLGFPKILMGKLPNTRDYEDSLIQEAHIKLEKPQSYMIDGDIQPATDDIKISIGPRLTLIVR